MGCLCNVHLRISVKSVLKTIDCLHSKSVGHGIFTEVVETREYRMRIVVDDVEKTSTVKSPTTQIS